MKTKAFFVTALMLLPAFAFGQDLYDDLYYTPGKDKPLPTRTVKPTAQKEVATEQSDNQYKIESTRVGNRDIVVVRNLNGDTVYYSGDNKDSRIDSSQVAMPNGEYANRIQRFHNANGTIILNGDDEDGVYPLDNVNWTVNVYGGNYGWGWPYYRHYPYGYMGGYYSPGYSSWYGSSWDWDWNFGWGYPYYYGGYYGTGYPYYGWGGYYSGGYPYYGWGGYYSGGYPYYGGGGYYGGWYGGRTRPSAYTTEGRRNALNISGRSRGTVAESRPSVSGSRSGSPAFNSTTTGTRSNTIGTRGNRQNTTFWNNFLSNRGYNVSGSRSSASDVSRSTPQYNTRGSYNSSSRSSEVVSVPSSGNYTRSNDTRSGSRSVTTYYNNNNNRSSSSSSYERSSSNNSNSSSYSSGSRQSYSSGSSSSYSSGGGGSSSGGGSRGGGGGGRR
jgi:hypothetical protein